MCQLFLSTLQIDKGKEIVRSYNSITSKIINPSNVQSTGLPLEYHPRLDPLCRESEQVIKSEVDAIMLPDNYNIGQIDIKIQVMPLIEPSDLFIRSFLMYPNINGDIIRSQIVEEIHTNDDEHRNDPEYIKFSFSGNDDLYEETLSYNEIK